MTQLATMVEKLRKTAVQRRDGGRAGSQNKHDPAVELEPTSGRRSRRCGAGTDADSEQGGRRTIPRKLAVTGGDVPVSGARGGGSRADVAPATLSLVRGAGKVLWGCLHLQK